MGIDYDDEELIGQVEEYHNLNILGKFKIFNIN